MNSVSRNWYSPPGTFDTEDILNGIVDPGSRRNQVEDENMGFINLQNVPRSVNTAQDIRKEFCEYRRVPWQDNFA